MNTEQNRDRFEELLDDYARDRLAPAEAQEFNALLASDPDLRQEAEDHRALLGLIREAPPVKAPAGLVAAAMARAREEAAAEEPGAAAVVDVREGTAPSETRRRGRGAPVWWTAAAAAVLAAGVLTLQPWAPEPTGTGAPDQQIAMAPESDTMDEADSAAGATLRREPAPGEDTAAEAELMIATAQETPEPEAVADDFRRETEDAATPDTLVASAAEPVEADGEAPEPDLPGRRTLDQETIASIAEAAREIETKALARVTLPEPEQASRTRAEEPAAAAPPESRAPGSAPRVVQTRPGYQADVALPQEAQDDQERDLFFGETEPELFSGTALAAAKATPAASPLSNRAVDLTAPGDIPVDELYFLVAQADQAGGAARSFSDAAARPQAVSAAPEDGLFVAEFPDRKSATVFLRLLETVPVAVEHPAPRRGAEPVRELHMPGTYGTLPVGGLTRTQAVKQVSYSFTDGGRMFGLGRRVVDERTGQAMRPQTQKPRVEMFEMEQYDVLLQTDPVSGEARVQLRRLDQPAERPRVRTLPSRVSTPGRIQ